MKKNKCMSRENRFSDREPKKSPENFRAKSGKKKPPILSGVNFLGFLG
jgi:hypothetical protein